MKPEPAGPAGSLAVATGSALGLTPREHDVLRLMGRGLKTVEIAKKLSINSRNARRYVDRVRAKLSRTASLMANAGGKTHQ